MKMKLEAAIKSLTDSVKNKDWAYGSAVQSVLHALAAAEKDSGELEQSLNVANAATQAWKQRAKAAELTALKGEQVSVITCYSCHKVMTRDQHAEADGFCPHCDVEIELDEDELFTAPQKPIISKEKLCDWLEDNFDIDDSQRDAFAACFAQACECEVKGDFILTASAGPSSYLDDHTTKRQVGDETQF